jgi:Asp-tRNA(Asn)/Glu-tRNA(Gln) amidotransferase A subunit family amidase
LPQGLTEEHLVGEVAGIMWSRRPLRLAEAQPIGADCVSWITCLEIFLPGCRRNGSDAEPFSGFRLTVSSWAILIAARAQKARRWLSQIRESEKSVIIPQQLAQSCRRAVRHPQEHDAARSLHGDAVPRPLLCQGAEPGAPAAARYDDVLSRCDLLLMPTLPIVATPLPEANAPIAEILQRGFEMLANTAQFDCTHHPAMSLPCSMVDGLPVGMMLVAKAFDEETIYRAAAAFERGVDWKTLVAS